MGLDSGAMASRSLALLPVALLVLAAPGLVACGDDSSASGTGGGGGAGGGATGGLTITEGCNPLAADSDCLVPYPSDVFLVDDPNTVTGRRVAVPEVAQIRFDEVAVDMTRLHPADGFSWQTPILALFPGGIDDANLPRLDDDFAISTSGSSPTLLVDTETGALVPHFAELDPRAFDDARRALVIRPQVRLEPGRRYVGGLKDIAGKDGALAPSPAGFADLRDRDGAGHPSLAALAPRYDAEVFPALEGLAPREDWQLAWDFTTSSKDDTQRDLLAVRQQTLDFLEEAGGAPEIVVDETIEGDPGSTLGLRINGTMTVPLFLTAPEPGNLLARDGAGDVTRNGTCEVPWSAWIPRSVLDGAGAEPARLLQYGHGFFGSREEAQDYPLELADEEGFVVIAVDWWGMSREDQAEVVIGVNERPAEALRFTDRVHQAMANQLALAALAQGPLLALPEMQLANGPAYDASTVYFHGNSMGHILGGTYVALAPQVERAALGVGGANFSLMLFRARPFLIFLGLLAAHVEDPLDQQKFGVFAQTSFDRIDPGSFAEYVLAEQLPGNPAERHVLVHSGLDDAAVTTLATIFHARVMGIPLLEPSPIPVPGLATQGFPADDGYVLFDFGLGLDLMQRASPPAEDNLVHDAVRNSAAAKAQVSAFLRPGGSIVQTCDGPCDPD